MRQDNPKEFFKGVALFSLGFAFFSLSSSTIISFALGKMGFDIVSILIAALSVKLLQGDFRAALWLRRLMVAYACAGSLCVAFPLIVEFLPHPYPFPAMPWWFLPMITVYGGSIGVYAFWNFLLLRKKWNDFF